MKYEGKLTPRRFANLVKLLEAEVRAIAAETPRKSYRGGDGAEYGPTPGNPNGCIIGYAVRRLSERATT